PAVTRGKAPDLGLPATARLVIPLPEDRVEVKLVRLQVGHDARASFDALDRNGARRRRAVEVQLGVSEIDDRPACSQCPADRERTGSGKLGQSGLQHTRKLPERGRFETHGAVELRLAARRQRTVVVELKGTPADFSGDL